MSGQDGSDAKPYQEREVAEAIRKDWYLSALPIAATHRLTVRGFYNPERCVRLRDDIPCKSPLALAGACLGS